MLLDSVILVYKVINDIVVYVVGNSAENELILQSVLQALDETVANLLKSGPHASTHSHARGWNREARDTTSRRSGACNDLRAS